MPHKAAGPGTPSEWLRRARSNLALASSPKPEEVLREDLCFECQQAAEKALKAVLLSKGIPFRFVHDIGELITLLNRAGLEIPADVSESVILTEYAVEARYPGPFEPVTMHEFEDALMLATAVVRWATEVVT